MTPLIRDFFLGDEADLSRVFQSSIRELASADYTSEQIEVWAGASFDLDHWIKRIQELKPFVVEIDGIISAYADLQIDGYIDHFFVAGKYPRQGLGSLLMSHIIENAIAKGITALTAEVSLNAQKFFTRFGFVVVEQRSRNIQGITLSNALMSCEIPSKKYSGLNSKKNYETF
jgi:putative acetyltransferase